MLCEIGGVTYHYSIINDIRTSSDLVLEQKICLIPQKFNQSNPCFFYFFRIVEWSHFVHNK